MYTDLVFLYVETIIEVTEDIEMHREGGRGWFYRKCMISLVLRVTCNAKIRFMAKVVQIIDVVN